MTNKFKQPGEVVDYANDTGSDIAAGAVVIMGILLGVALVDIADGESGAVAIEGVFELAKTAGTAWVEGNALDWDASASAFQVTATITPASGDLELCAVAHAVAASAATVGLVRLTPNPAATYTA